MSSGYYRARKCIKNIFNKIIDSNHSMKKLITVFLFILNSLYLVSSSFQKYTLTNNFIASKDLYAAIDLMQKGIVIDVVTQKDFITLEFSKVEIGTFRKKRIKEYHLMEEELRSLKRIIALRNIQKEKESNYIKNDIIVYFEQLISQRKKEEKLNTVEFLDQYIGRWSDLVSDVINTNNRLSDIKN